MSCVSMNSVSGFPEQHSLKKKGIISGVVEGFYGRPWTQEQRKHLFQRLKSLGMNTYLYAPKDDIKHRAEWRVPYTKEEMVILTDLLQSAKEHQINFVYSLSPGQDIIYSDEEEINHIKVKLDQVKTAGCESFAILFDDIEVEMHENDKIKFNTFSIAQVSVTNDLFEYLNYPEFYFCPTEYCDSRAKPSLTESEYLNNIGRNLNSAIHVLWTGPRVISRTITIENIRLVASVLRRKPLIWDNLHANDYDPKRIFMGPFIGRAVALKDEISGMLLNPNCKYEANFVPLNTLGDWIAADADSEDKDGSPMAIDSPVTYYKPLESVRNAINAWMDDFNGSTGPCIPPVPRVDDDGLETKSNDTVEMKEEQSIQLPELIQAVVQSPQLEIEPVNSLCVDYVEHMDEKPFSIEEAPITEEQQTMINVLTDVNMEPENKEADFEQIASLVDIFYLPFHNGQRATESLEIFTWMVEHSNVVNGSLKDDNSPLHAEYEEKYQKFLSILQNFTNMFRFITECQNKALVSELIPFCWEAHGISSVLLGVAKWIHSGKVKKNIEEISRFWEKLLDDEPWTINGGFLPHVNKALTFGMQTLSLLNNKGLLPLSVVDYSIRPLKASELNCVTVLATSEDERTSEQNDLNRQLFMDKFITPFTDMDEDFMFVVENNSLPGFSPLMCFGVALFDGLKFMHTIPMYIESLQQKYATVEVSGVNMTALVKEMPTWFPTISHDVFIEYPSWIDIRFNVDAYEAVPAKKLIHTICAALTINGSKGVLTALPLVEGVRMQYFERIGFAALGTSSDGQFELYGHKLCAPLIDSTE